MKKAVIMIFLTLLIFPLSPMKVYALADNSTQSLNIGARGAVLIDQDSGRILYYKNFRERLYPASTTKMLTALIAIENGKLDDMITIGEEIQMLPWDASNAGLKVGEEISLHNLLMALLLPSGNDAAMSIAVYTGRKLNNDKSMGINEAVEFFSGLMNKKAAEIGAADSHFVNPHGYHDDDHYSTAMDLALIAREAMKNPVFREIVKTGEYKVEDKYVFSSGKPQADIAHEWVNTNMLINIQNDGSYYPYATGIKTGHTDEAGYCLVSSATKNGLNLISVVLNTTAPGRWDDSKTMLEYGFDNFQYYQFVNKGDIEASIKIENYSKDSNGELTAITEYGYRGFFNKKDISNIKCDISWDPGLIAKDLENGDAARITSSINKGQYIGKAVYSLEGKTIATINLMAGEDIKKQTPIEAALAAVEPVHILYLSAGIIILALIIAVNRIFSIRGNRD